MTIPLKVQQVVFECSGGGLKQIFRYSFRSFQALSVKWSCRAVVEQLGAFLGHGCGAS